jgi:serpin B
MSGCAAAATPVPKQQTGELARQDPPADAPVAQLVAGITTFGYKLAPDAAAQNWVASPASIALVMAMLRAGAAGSTAAEIDAAFGFPAGVHGAFNALSRQIVTVAVPAPPSDESTRAPGAPARPSIVSIGSAIFTEQGYPIKQSYLDTLAQQYGVGIYPLQFRQPTAAKDAIDAWAKQQTAGRVDHVFDQLDAETRAVVANTVYFKGEWKTPFEAARTSDRLFRRADGSTVTAATMADDLSVGYAAGQGWQAIELPYGEDGAYVMRVFLPTGDLSPRDLLAPAIQASATFTTQEIDVQLPKWDFAADLPLVEDLKRLGVVSIFDPNTADLSGISSESLYIQQAIHRAMINVDEYGSEAAAVTAAAMVPAMARGSEPVPFHADHPFAFAIAHKATGTPLFYGIVADPTASQP